MDWNQLQDYISQMSEAQKNMPVLVVTKKHVREIQELFSAVDTIDKGDTLVVPVGYFYLE
jgi:prefoldin subunit 5